MVRLAARLLPVATMAGGSPSSRSDSPTFRGDVRAARLGLVVGEAKEIKPELEKLGKVFVYDQELKLVSQ